MKTVNKKDSTPNDLVLLLAFVIAVISLSYIFKHKQSSVIGLSIGIGFILYGLFQDLTISLTIASLIGVLVVKYTLQRNEGFKNEDESEEEEEEEKPAPKKASKSKKKKLAPPPDNGDRAEMFELGKKYKAPSEEDDKDFHLDAGTTFLNAYKSLKPDQVAAMTKDTQDLMQTQKQLMSTLHTLKPLIKDGKEMMNMFQSYFGAGEPTAS